MNQTRKSLQLTRCFVFISIVTILISCKAKTTEETPAGHDTLPEEKNLVQTVVIQIQP